MRRAAWQDDPDRACANVPETKKLCFFPEHPQTSVFSYNVAKEVCESCPSRIKEKCLEQGLSEKYGVWGGLDPKERIELLKQRRRAA